MAGSQESEACPDGFKGERLQCCRQPGCKLGSLVVPDDSRLDREDEQLGAQGRSQEMSSVTDQFVLASEGTQMDDDHDKDSASTPRISFAGEVAS